MRYSLLFALRYLFSKKSHNAVNYISWITVLGFTVGSFALIVILSTLNGFEHLIMGMYSRFDPDFKIEANEGKIFVADSSFKNMLLKTPGLISFHEVLEEQAVIKHFDYQTACYVKGVDMHYFDETQLAPYVLEGSSKLFENNEPQAIVGAGIDFKIQTRVESPMSIATIFAPRRGDFSINDPNLIMSLNIKPSGVIYLDDQINQKYVFVPLSFARDLFEREEGVSFYEIRVAENKIKDAQSYLAQFTPKNLKLKNRIEQQEALYRMFKSEKWVTYALLTFVMLLASFNVTGSLTMLVVEKRKDIFTLKTLGANAKFIRSIFLSQGMLIAFLGGIIGLALGVTLILAQIKFDLVTMSGAIVESYPVKLITSDILLIFGTTIVLGFITSFYPSWKAYSEN